MNLFSDRSSIGSHQYNSLWRIFFLLLLVGATPVFIWAVMTQRIELRKRAATSEAVICWNRVGGTAPSLYWPNGCKGNPTPQMCTQATVSLTASEIYKYNEWVANGKPYIPGCGMTPPNTTSINWKTQYAYLFASDMVISANGKIFKGVASGPMTVHSNPASATYTTLESTWTENGVEMRMFIYFDASACTRSLPPQCSWRITELRIYNGNAQGDWIYFKGGDVAAVGARVGAEYSNPKLILTSSENGIGKVEFSNLKLRAFTNQTTPPTSCSGPNGSTCSIGACPTCKPGMACPAIACRVQSGTCQNGQCVATPAGGTCGGIRGEVCQAGYSCMYSNGSTRPQFPDESGKCVPQATTCTADGASCSLRVCPTMPPCPPGIMCKQVMPACTVSAGVCKAGRCLPPITPTPTCIPRPACMDPLPGQPQCMPDVPPGGWICPKKTPTPTCMPRPACMDPLPGQPQCMFKLVEGGWFCPKTTPTPSTVCKTGVNSFGVGAACPSDSSRFLSANYACYDGVKGTVGNNTCQTSLALANLAQQACAGHSSCSTTPTGAKKPGDFNGDGKVNILDYNVILANFGKTGPVGFSPADLNADGKVNLLDYNMLLNYFGK